MKTQPFSGTTGPRPTWPTGTPLSGAANPGPGGPYAAAPAAPMQMNPQTIMDQLRQRMAPPSQPTAQPPGLPPALANLWARLPPQLQGLLGGAQNPLTGLLGGSAGGAGGGGVGGANPLLSLLGIHMPQATPGPAVGPQPIVASGNPYPTAQSY